MLRAALAPLLLLAPPSLAQSGQCQQHGDCQSCVGDKSLGCGWCIIGQKNDAKCLGSQSSCEGLWENKECPDCHKPWIRFANTVPSDNTLDCTITQGNRSYTWSGYKFGEFSDWVQHFEVGQGTMTISSGGKQLTSSTGPLTPGPLVVVVKGTWPVITGTQIETIAASYNPIPTGKAGVRLFNLSPDTKKAGMKIAGKAAADNIAFTLGSDWTQADVTNEAFEVYDDSSPATALTSLQMVPPAGASSVFLLGLQNKSAPAGMGIQAKSIIDAPQACGGAPPATPAPTPAPTPRPTPPPTPPPTPAPTPPPCPRHADVPACHQCCSGYCLHCKGCVHDKTGACAACWTIAPQDRVTPPCNGRGAQCLSDDGLSCQACWSSAPLPRPPAPALPAVAPAPSDDYCKPGPECEGCCAATSPCKGCRGLCEKGPTGGCAACYTLYSPPQVPPCNLRASSCLRTDGVKACEACWYP